VFGGKYVLNRLKRIECMREFSVQAVHTIFESKVLVKKHDQLFIFGHGNKPKQGDADGDKIQRIQKLRALKA
jgi:hypothetical protein